MMVSQGTEDAIHAELKQLLSRQIETLTTHRIGELTEEEIWQYVRRNARIRELCRQLALRNDLAA